jgi:hypothetical protein
MNQILALIQGMDEEFPELSMNRSGEIILGGYDAKAAICG